jgi:hypothetical protein
MGDAEETALREQTRRYIKNLNKVIAGERAAYWVAN